MDRSMWTNQQKELMQEARQAAMKAYAPYSKFRVGAAVLAESGVFYGANVENSSTNLGICAERVAISHALMHDAGKILGIAVYCKDAPGDRGGGVELHMPCGGCRQWLAELAPEAWVITSGSQEVFTL